MGSQHGSPHAHSPTRHGFCEPDAPGHTDVINLTSSPEPRNVLELAENADNIAGEKENASDEEAVEEDMEDADDTTISGKTLSCYLLVSKSSAKKGRSYIGFTVEPARRERQHNGELASGAYRSKRLRPAEIAVVVTGFYTRVQALQFEWAWQHPLRSRHVRQAARELGVTDKTKQPHKKVQVLFRMLNLPPWCVMPLSVHFSSARHADMQRDCVEVPGHIHVRVSSLQNISVEAAKCASCGESPSESDRSSELSARCPNCSERYHPVCLAESFLASEPGDSIVPSGGVCPSCKTHAPWDRWLLSGPSQGAPSERSAVAQALETPESALQAAEANGHASAVGTTLSIRGNLRQKQGKKQSSQRGRTSSGRTRGGGRLRKHSHNTKTAPRTKRKSRTTSTTNNK